jgi:hypothetical protein
VINTGNSMTSLCKRYRVTSRAATEIQHLARAASAILSEDSFNQIGLAGVILAAV